MKSHLIRSCVSLAAAALLAGCSMSGGTTTSSDTGATSSPEAASATAAEAQAIATSMTQTQAGGTSGGAVPSYTADTGSACPQKTIESAGSDGWTDELLTFTNPPCSFSGPRGYATLAITGTLELTRSNGDGYNFSSTAKDLEWAFTGASATYSETRNGTRSVSASASSASATNDMQVTLQGAKYDGKIADQMTAAFTPVAGSTLSRGEPLPAGDFTYQGNVTWSGSDGTAGTFAVSTVTPLAYNPSCKSSQASVFDSGELKVKLTTEQGNGYAKITWSNCGAPSVVFVAD